MGFPRQEYWSGFPFPSLRDLSNPGIKPASPAMTGRFFTTEPPGEKAMATHFSILVWRIPGTTEPGGLLSTGLHRVEHD